MTVRELILLLEKHEFETPVLYHTADYDSSYGYDVDVEKVIEKWGQEYKDSPGDYGWNTSDCQKYPEFKKVVVLE